MQKLDIIKIHKRTEEIYVELKKKYPDNKEMNELRQYFTKILELLNKITISEIWSKYEIQQETPTSGNGIEKD